jgi:hypothetical protein
VRCRQERLGTKLQLDLCRVHKSSIVGVSKGKVRDAQRYMEPFLENLV